MQIKVTENFKILSHSNDKSFLLFNSNWIVKIHPGLLKFSNIKNNETFEISINFEGPCQNFTIENDIKNEKIKVFFNLEKFYFSYFIKKIEGKIYLLVERSTVNNLEIDFQKKYKAEKNLQILLPIDVFENQNFKEILHFGVHKEPILENILIRKNIFEILPFIYLNSQAFKEEELDLSSRYLGQIADKFLNKKGNISDLENIYKAFFYDLLIPRVKDLEYQNILPSEEEFFRKTPFFILKKYFSIIRNLFFIENELEIYILPNLLKCFAFGRFINIISRYGTFHIQWSKKVIFKLIFIPNKDISLKIKFQKNIKKYRLKDSKKSKGKIFENQEEILFLKSKIYFFDKFFN